VSLHGTARPGLPPAARREKEVEKKGVAPNHVIFGYVGGPGGSMPAIPAAGHVTESSPSYARLKNFHVGVLNIYFRRTRACLIFQLRRGIHNSPSPLKTANWLRP
jgi:hypothetical protein